MVFSSILFLYIFLPTALGLYFVSPRAFRLPLLTLLSYLFYAWNDPRFVLLLIWTTFFDYTMGSLIGGTWWPGGRLPPRGVRRAALGLSLCSSIGLLFWFKYFGFAQEVGLEVASWFTRVQWTIRHIVLPAGISFYTFESISYVIDIYRGIAAPAARGYHLKGVDSPRPAWSWLCAEGRGFVAFACYLAQFPHLVAGPIIRFQELEKQLHRPRPSLSRFARGVMWLSLGLSKKVLLADTLAPSIETIFSAQMVSFHLSWFGAIAFAFQIYFDFSGYTDMALGLAMMLGFRFPENFNSPYRAHSITEFWRRWHITLSRWLRDYIYIPLGGNRCGSSRTYLHLLATMLIGGIWHGAAMKFVIWGGYHGVWLALEKALDLRESGRGWRSALRVPVTFLIVCLGWVFFRAADALLAVDMLHRMLWPMEPSSELIRFSNTVDGQALAAFLCAGLIVFIGVKTRDFCWKITLVRGTIALLLLATSMVVLMVRASVPFLYFQF